jgi:hypothetical protein
MRENEGLFGGTREDRMRMRVHMMMSRQVETRTHQQCRSHHQKMIKRFGTLERMFECLRKERKGPALPFLGSYVKVEEGSPVYLQEGTLEAEQHLDD